MRQKLIFLEAVRGFGALLVTFVHYSAAFYPATIFGSNYPLHAQWERYCIRFPFSIVFAGHAALCVFFILSGYVLSLPFLGRSAKPTKDLMGAIIKRPFRLGGMVIFSEILAAWLLGHHAFYNIAAAEVTGSSPWFSQYWTATDGTFGRIATDISLYPFSRAVFYNPPLWTIETELIGSYLTFGILLFFRGWRIRWIVYGTLIVLLYGSMYQGFLFGIIFADVAQNHQWLLVRLSRVTVTVPLMAVGLVCASYPVFAGQVDMTGTFYGMLPSVAAIGGGYSMVGAVMLVAFVFLSKTAQRFLESEVSAFFGRISYAVYALHFLVLGSLSSWLFLRLLGWFSYGESFLLMFCVSIPILLICATLVTRWIDQPSILFSNKLGRLFARPSQT